MKKVYCGNCSHWQENWYDGYGIGGGEKCLVYKTKDTPISKKEIYLKAEKLNKNNNCLYYEQANYNWLGGKKEASLEIKKEVKR